MRCRRCIWWTQGLGCGLPKYDTCPMVKKKREVAGDAGKRVSA
jgi:hypothetical protein